MEKDIYRVIKSYDTPFGSYELHSNFDNHIDAYFSMSEEFERFLDDAIAKGDYERLNICKTPHCFASWPVDEKDYSLELFTARCYKEGGTPVFIDPKLKPGAFLRFFEEMPCGIKNFDSFKNGRISFDFFGCSMNLFEQTKGPKYFWDIKWNDKEGTYSLGILLNYLRDFVLRRRVNIYDNVYEKNRCRIYFFEI